MAKILDRLYNRVIDGDILEISDAEIANLGLAKASEVGTKLYKHFIYDTTDHVWLLVISNKSSHYTKEELSDLEINNEGIVYMACGNDDSSAVYIIFAFGIDSDNVGFAYTSGEELGNPNIEDFGVWTDIEHDYTFSPL